MKLAVIGSGISGLTAAWRLHIKHDITVYEAGSYIGGHTNTRDVTLDDGSQWAVDTGFIVFNHETYPHFLEMMNTLGVETQPTNMSFSVSNRRTGLEFSGSGLKGLFSQKRNLFNPRFHGMVRDILAFRNDMSVLLESGNHDITLGEFVRSKGYGKLFWSDFLAPMGAAIWSTPDEEMADFPATFFARFFHNHRFLDTNNQPQWYVIKGGSRSYIKYLTEGFADRIRLNCPVRAVTRDEHGVEITAADGSTERFDKVIMAAHSDQTLRMLADADSLETEILSSFPYQRNLAILHTDSSIMPRCKGAWASWNHHVADNEGPVSVTYDMTRLQSLNAPEHFLVTLNNDRDIDDSKVIEKIEYHHPLFTKASAVAQERHSEINGKRHTFYCGAYWRYGFHEDGVFSAIQAVKELETAPSNQEVMA